MSRRSASVRVPATSANLGPGFDSLGVALDWTARITITLDDEPLEPPRGPIDSMASTAAIALFRHAQIEVPAGLQADYEGDIPVGRGLGVSAFARVGGLVAANSLIDGEYDDDTLLALATRLEGHADNAAPALLGGLQVTVETDDALKHVTIEPPDDLRVALLIPSFSMPTEESRKKLPEQLTREEAVHNIGRAALLVAAFQQRRYDLLATATEDVLHQPARGQIFEAMFPIFEAARGAGALAVYLSGGGPTVAALAVEGLDVIAEAMQAAAAEHDVRARTKVTAMSTAGAQLLPD